MSEPVAVDVGGCRCPGTPHESDIVYLEPEITLPMGMAALIAMRMGEPTVPAMTAAITGAELPLGIRSWTFTDEAGEEEPRTRENLERLIPWDNGGMEVAERADALYGERLMAPLLKRLSASAPSGRTGGSTSPIRLSGHRPPKSSRPSSPGVSAMKQSAASGR